MLDLKAKLAAAGLVTPAELAAAERKSGPNRGQHSSPQSGPQAGQHANQNRGQNTNQNRGQNSGQPREQNREQPRNHNAGPARAHDSRPRPAPADRKPPAPRSGLDVPALQKAGKGAAYDAIRRLIERARIDPLHAIPGEQAEAFHFTTASGQLSRLMLEPEARTQLGDGTAGIVGFMSHHGLAHCVVPRIVAEDIARLFPFWLRVLKDHPGAGQQEPPREPREPREPRDPTPVATSTAPAEPAAPTADPTAGT
jgi:hypothetical protein